MKHMKQVSAMAVGGLVAALSSAAAAADFEVGQHNKTFVQKDAKVEQLEIKAGDTVHFKNFDPFFHNVFSLSDIQAFDLGSYPAGQSKAVKFAKPGTVEVECAIHPQMYLKVEVK